MAVFDSKNYEKPYYQGLDDLKFHFFENRLTEETVELGRGFTSILCFVNDQLNRACLQKAHDLGVKYIGLRCAGFNQVDLKTAHELGIVVARVPGYSPHSVAEFALLQMLCLARKFHRSVNRTKELNFSLDGLVGHALYGKTIGVLGVGQIGQVLIELLDGFRCNVIAYDSHPRKELCENRNLKFVSLDQLFSESDFLSLHVPLSPETLHLVNRQRLSQMKMGSFLVNTGRGGLVDSKALIGALKEKRLTGAALDVYEEEEKYFSHDFSDSGIDDDHLARLISFPNVIITSHQAYLTELSLQQIALTTIENLRNFYSGHKLINEVRIG